MDRYEYCKIFVHGADPARAVGLLGALLGAAFDDEDSLTFDGIEVDVLGNPDGVPGAADFLRWPALVEVEPLDAPPSATVGLVARILTGLHDAGHLAVAACDYEDELPWSGGIRLFDRWAAGLDRGAGEGAGQA
ncbi:hypothetical protein ACIPYS_05325 [Kitasatospora sp. NPDC089913]|uniref:hypothetical protein n=1 Tax=Kitasatospora sp. NPDC089913 TaxID=3364080 RepID=UPI0037FD5A69